MHGDVTELLSAWTNGDTDALERLVPLVYSELHRIAAGHMRRERADHNLQATALIHEAYLKLVDQSRVAWRDRGHFFALASVAMRHVLVDRARACLTQKREGLLQRVALDNEQIPDEDQPEVMLDINDAVDRSNLAASASARVRRR